MSDVTCTVRCADCDYVESDLPEDQAAVRADVHADETGHDVDYVPLCGSCGKADATLCRDCRTYDHCESWECLPRDCAREAARDTKADQDYAEWKERAR